MYCYKCGARIPDNGKFCSRCGTAAVGSANAPQAPTNSQQTLAVSKRKHRLHIGGMELCYLIIVTVVIVFIVALIVVNTGSQRLVGEWRNTTDDSPEYMEFYSDGTVAVGDSYGLNWEDEREVFDYHVEGSRLIFEENRESVLNVEYQLDGNLLRLDMEDGESLTFRKAT